MSSDPHGEDGGPGPCPVCGKVLVRIEKDGLGDLNCLCGFIGSLDGPALTVLRDDNPLFRIIWAACGKGSQSPLIDEEENVGLLVLSVLGKTSVQVGGLTSSGKSALVDHVLKVFPEGSFEKVGGMTDKALRYLSDDVKVLYITELRGMQSGRKVEESTSQYD